jgi:hypothetical protein
MWIYEREGGLRVIALPLPKDAADTERTASFLKAFEQKVKEGFDELSKRRLSRE